MTLKNIMLIGARGNMGSRYLHILLSLKVKAHAIDLDSPEIDWRRAERECDGIIIATPTHTHYEVIKNLRRRNVPILCEKPITKSEDEFSKLLALFKFGKMTLTMVNQYNWCIDHKDSGETKYDYFKTGKDGLIWDCLNIIGLGMPGDVSLKNQSPVYNCIIRGRRITLDMVDSSYVLMLHNWLKKPESNIDYVEKVHRYVFQQLSDGNVG